MKKFTVCLSALSDSNYKYSIIFVLHNSENAMTDGYININVTVDDIDDDTRLCQLTTRQLATIMKATADILGVAFDAIDANSWLWLRRN